MKSFLRLLAISILLAAAQAAQADWFVSAEVKALKIKAEAGDMTAQFLVGTAYDFGRGAPRDLDEALKWYRMAAESGHSNAQNNMGSALQERKRYDEARVWYERAAAQDHAQAINSLGYLYDLGLGVAQDRRKGFELYQRAADLGWAEAMWNIANQYGAGDLGPVDLEMACIWTFRAERHAKAHERQLLARLHHSEPLVERQLNAEQRKRCYQQAAEWAPAGVKAAQPADAVPINDGSGARP